jgi:hypothetical protein
VLQLLLQLCLFVFISMLYFSNSMYYTLVLLILSVSLLYYLASSFSLSVLLFLAVVIVYVGAMMILIGYICAIRPNVSFNSSFSLSFLPLLLSLLLLWVTFLSPYLSYSSYSDLSSFFYSDMGLFLFVVLFSSLFLTLLIVTTQYSSPKGPFRSSRV